MMRLPGIVKPRAFLFAAALLALVASPLAAQQATVRAPVGATGATPVSAPTTPPAPVGEAGATPVSAPTTPLPGPRLRAEWRPVEPSFSESRESPLSHSSNQTITVSTLVLVLAVVILVLLVAR